jgi:hypothetical protein
MPITFEVKESSYLCSQTMLSLYTQTFLAPVEEILILPSEAALQEYLKFSYECFLAVLLLFEGYLQ